MSKNVIANEAKQTVRSRVPENRAGLSSAVSQPHREIYPTARDFSRERFEKLFLREAQSLLNTQKVS
jgi:hypothetical protein